MVLLLLLLYAGLFKNRIPCEWGPKHPFYCGRSETHGVTVRIFGNCLKCRLVRPLCWLCWVPGGMSRIRAAAEPADGSRRAPKAEPCPLGAAASPALPQMENFRHSPLNPSARLKSEHNEFRYSNCVRRCWSSMLCWEKITLWKKVNCKETKMLKHKERSNNVL